MIEVTRFIESPREITSYGLENEHGVIRMGTLLFALLPKLEDKKKSKSLLLLFFQYKKFSTQRLNLANDVS